MSNYEAFWGILRCSERIVFFGGAGVSTESGIPDFRGAKGIYNEKFGTLQPETIVSGRFFNAHPEEFYKFYKEKMLFPNARPNGAHKALAILERTGKLSAVVTQNIDGLHQIAGSKKVIELHGTAQTNYCVNCAARYKMDYIVESDGVPKCKVCGGLVRPDVTLFDEELPDEAVKQAVDVISDADTLIIAGTSLTVMPASALPYYFEGKRLVIINFDETSLDSAASLVIREPVGKVLYEAVKAVFPRY